MRIYIYIPISKNKKEEQKKKLRIKCNGNFPVFMALLYLQETCFQMSKLSSISLAGGISIKYVHSFSTNKTPTSEIDYLGPDLWFTLNSAALTICKTLSWQL